MKPGLPGATTKPFCLLPLPPAGIPTPTPTPIPCPGTPTLITPFARFGLALLITVPGGTTVPGWTPVIKPFAFLLCTFTNGA